MAAKRKRDTEDMGHMRAAPGMAMPTDFEQGYFHDDGAVHGGEGMDFTSMLAHHAQQDPGHHAEDDENDGHNHPQQQQRLQQQQRQGLRNPGQSASDTAAAAMAQYHTMRVPQPTEQTFMQQQNSEQQGDRQGSATGEPGSAQQRTASFGEYEGNAPRDGQGSPNGDTSPTGRAGSDATGPKPAVGSDEWHKVRRDNHKEVERRRRETINEGINELAKIVPGCEKNKGSILARAVQFITQLKENETQNIEKWTLEKLLTEQAIAELSSSCDKLKAECQRAWAECEGWKKAAQKAGVGIPDEKQDAEGEDAD